MKTKKLMNLCVVVCLLASMFAFGTIVYASYGDSGPGNPVQFWGVTNSGPLGLLNFGGAAQHNGSVRVDVDTDADSIYKPGANPTITINGSSHVGASYTRYLTYSDGMRINISISDSNYGNISFTLSPLS